MVNKVQASGVLEYIVVVFLGAKVISGLLGGPHVAALIVGCGLQASGSFG